MVCGGVACNSGLRKAMHTEADRSGRQVIFPSPALCGDNAAMLGVAADYYLTRQIDTNAVKARASWTLDQVTSTLSDYQ